MECAEQLPRLPGAGGKRHAWFPTRAPLPAGGSIHAAARRPSHVPHGLPLPAQKRRWGHGVGQRASDPRDVPAPAARDGPGTGRPPAPRRPAEYPLSGHPNVPTVLIYAAEDEIFEPAWERFMARELLGVEPIEISGGHFPMAEDPEALADLLDRLVREHTASS
jgi:pimeloyl-ACP methyl ester carboxylesterase